MLISQGRWMFKPSSWQKEDETAVRSSQDDDMGTMNPLCHSDPMWWATGLQSSFHRRQRDVVCALVHSESKSALGNGTIFSLTDSHTMQDEFRDFSPWNMEKIFSQTGMPGIPTNSQSLRFLMSFLKTFLRILKSLQPFQSLQEDQDIQRKFQID